MERFVKTYHTVYRYMDYEINRDVKKRNLTIISVSIMSDGRGGIFASVVFEKGGDV